MIEFLFKAGGWIALAIVIPACCIAQILVAMRRENCKCKKP